MPQTGPRRPQTSTDGNARGQLLRKKRLLDKLSSLRMWSGRGQMAPHKPLLFLYALGRFANGQRRLSYEEVDRDVGNLLQEFGPSSRSVHTEHPFWRLQNDGLWQVHTDG